MDFTTGQAAPIIIKIDGQAFTLPRFLMPELKTWAAHRQKAASDLALAQFKDDELRARFLMYFQPAAIDVVQLLEDATTPEGVTYILTTALDAAKVPEATRDALLAQGEPSQLRTLARTLLSATGTLGDMRNQSDDKGPRSDPTSGQQPESGGSPVTISAT